jgi:hypothetical protein
MLAEQLKTIDESDQQDTPKLDGSWASLIVWAFGRFGGIIIGTAFLAYAWNDSNETHKRQTERLISILEARSASDTELARALNQLSDVVAQLKREAEVAHTKLAK